MQHKDDSVLLQPLGKLHSFDPSKIISNTAVPSEVDLLVLALAIAYNDLKDIMFWQGINQELTSPIPNEGQVDKSFGQRCGIDNHLFRLSCSWLVEMLTLLEKNSEALKTSLWQKLLKKMSVEQKSAWHDLLSLMNLTESSGIKKQKLREILRYLIQVRSHGGFHYYQTKPFANGYRGHFDGKTPQQTKAYVSVGKNLEETRFFFADAAATVTTQRFAADLSINPNEYIPQFIKKSHIGIRGVIYAYLKIKQTILQSEK